MVHEGHPDHPVYTTVALLSFISVVLFAVGAMLVIYCQQEFDRWTDRKKNCEANDDMLLETLARRANASTIQLCNAYKTSSSL